MVLREVLRPVEQAVSAYGLVQIVTALLLIGTLLLRPQGFFGSSEPRFLRPGPAVLKSQGSDRSDRRNRPAVAPADS
jgi:branched-chain amino acid transport system permease protein